MYSSLLYSFGLLGHYKTLHFLSRLQKRKKYSVLGENTETHIGIIYEVTACGGSPRLDPYVDPSWYSLHAAFTSSFSELTSEN